MTVSFQTVVASPPGPYASVMIHSLNQNAGAVTALATLALLLVTGWYAWTTRALLREASNRDFNLMSRG